MFRSLACRDLQPELMDQPGIEADRHRTALAGLARTNRVSGVSSSFWRRIRRSIAAERCRNLTLCDIASGAGDVAAGVWRRARRAGVNLKVTGYDISPFAVETAQTRADADGIDARFEVRDVLTCPPET